MRNSYRIIVLLLAVIFIALALRAIPSWRATTNAPSLNALASMQQAVANGCVAKSNAIACISFVESAWQIYIIILPYHYLQGYLTLLETASLIRLLMVIYAILVIFLFARKITNSNEAGIFASLLFAIYPNAIAAEAFSQWWVGSFYVSLFLLGSILALLYAKDNIDNKDKVGKLVFWSIASIIQLILAFVLWKGGIFAIVCYSMVLFFIVLYDGFNLNIKVSLAATMMLIGILYVVFLLSSNGLWSFSDVNSTGISTNFVLMATMQPNLAAHFALSKTDFLSTGDILILQIGVTIIFILPILVGFIISTWLVFKTKFPHSKEHREIIVILLLLILIGFPPTLTDAYFASLIIMEIAILAGVALAVMEHKRFILSMVLLELVLVAIELIFL